MKWAALFCGFLTSSSCLLPASSSTPSSLLFCRPRIFIYCGPSSLLLTPDMEPDMESDMEIEDDEYKVWLNLDEPSKDWTPFDHFSASTIICIKMFIKSWENFITTGQPKMNKLQGLSYIQRSPTEAFHSIEVRDIKQYLTFRCIHSKKKPLHRSTVETYFKTLQMTYASTTNKELGKMINVEIHEVSLMHLLLCFQCQANK